MKKYGIENFKFEILQECRVKDLDRLEQFYIGRFNSYEEGYNRTLGGQTFPSGKLSVEDVIEITLLLRESLFTMTEIAEKYNVTLNTITLINNGTNHKRDIKYPIRDFKANAKLSSVRGSVGRAVRKGRNTYLGFKIVGE